MIEALVHVGDCPDCGWPIYQGSVRHSCKRKDRLEGDVQYIETFIYDVIIVPRSQLKDPTSTIDPGSIGPQRGT